MVLMQRNPLGSRFNRTLLQVGSSLHVHGEPGIYTRGSDSVGPQWLHFLMRVVVTEAHS